MTLRALVRRRLDLPVASACVLAFVARVLFGWISPRHAGGDQQFFLDAGAYLREHGWFVPCPEVGIRPPGTSYVVAVAGVIDPIHVAEVTRVINAGAWATACWLIARIVAHILPGSPRAPWIAAGIAALDPVTIELSSKIMSENLAIPIQLAGVLIGLRLLSSPGLRSAACLGLMWSVAAFFRSDTVVEAGALLLAAGVHALRSGPEMRRTVLVWTGALATAVASTAAWRGALAAAPGPEPSHSVGLLQFVRARSGLQCWLRTINLPRRDWFDIAYRGPGVTRPDALPHDAFDSAAEMALVKAAFSIDLRVGSARSSADAELCRVGCARWRRDPMRALIQIPVTRLYRVWIDPEDSDLPRSYGDPVYTFRGNVFHACSVASRWLAVLGVTWTVALTLTLPSSAHILGWLVVARSAVCVIVLPTLLVLTAYEARYVTISHVLALSLITVAALAPAQSKKPGGSAS